MKAVSKLQKALEKAKEARGDSLESLTLVPEVPEASDKGSVACLKRQEIPAPVYFQTRKLPVDFNQLIQNRIIPICHGNPAADRIKILRTQVLSRMTEEGKNTLLITSANPGEGKTLTAINLAISIAHEMDRTTLLVDTDLRKPSIHSYFGFEASRGLSDYLKEGTPISDLLISPGIEKLVILPGGQPMSNSSELLGSPRMEALVKELKERYPDRFIIFDSSSLLTCADALVFSRFIDGILIVVEAERTTRSDLKRTFEMLGDKPVIGTLLNKSRD
ncbi:tyrosine-protein kinase [Syntrophus aciditrophicus SB]|uniref:Tyrosine-protein kinase n=1 Tax=Syntrophus aciditrophicus (strain SB) TaxID=56780 RepID=Q2LVT4_SYNAS|nr:tyrosine-protein kinase [Syntrophus aciditrophicus SB]